MPIKTKFLHNNAQKMLESRNQSRIRWLFCSRLSQHKVTLACLCCYGILETLTYFVDEKECEIFDKQFPPKEKLKLPGQLW